MSLDTTIQGWIDAAIAEERKYVDPLLAELRARLDALEAAERHDTTRSAA